MERDPNPSDGWVDPGPRRWRARWWFARFAFSFIVLGAVAAYESYRARERGADGRATLLFVVAAGAIGLGLTGLRMRHRN